MSTILETEPARQSTEHLAGLLRNDREATANFVVALARFDKDRHWVALGYNCLFNFVHRELKMSRSAAYFRTKAAELVQRYPEIVEPLRDGRLCITAVAQLSKVMNDQNRSSILERFFHQSNKVAKEIVAEIAPVLEPPRRELVTALRTISLAGANVGRDVELMLAGGDAPAIADSRRESVDQDQPGTSVTGSGEAANSPVAAPTANSEPAGILNNNSGPAGLAAVASATTEPADGWTQPLTSDLHRLHVTVTREFLRKLAAARNALAHRHRTRPSGSGSGWSGRNAEVIEVGLDLILRRDAKNKGMATSPRKDQRPCAPDHVPARVKREVGERDGWQCQYPLDSGGICGSRRNLQFDHIRPVALGGPSTVENLRLLCAHHNALAARLVFGNEVMDAFTNRGRINHSASHPPTGT